MQPKHTHRGFRDLAQLRAAGLDDGLEVLQRLLGLLDDAPGHDLHRRGVERDAPRAEEQLAGLDALRVRPDRGGGLCGRARGGVSVRWYVLLNYAPRRRWCGARR